MTPMNRSTAPALAVFALLSVALAPSVAYAQRARRVQLPPRPSPVRISVDAVEGSYRWSFALTNAGAEPDDWLGDDKLSDLHEFSIAAMLWDLNDIQQDGRSRSGGRSLDSSRSERRSRQNPIPRSRRNR